MTSFFIWDIDREIISLGSFALRWYSMLFAAGIIIGYFMVRSFFRAEGKNEALMDSLLMHIVIGTVVGARLGHCLFYEPGEYLSNPLRILKVWEGGLASHGGFLGVITAIMIFCRNNRSIGFLWLCDRVAIPAMIAAACIRLGNFFNSEIVGRPTDVPWAVIFQKHDMLPRHPTQLYEALGYLVIFGILYAAYRLQKRQVPEGQLLGGVFVLGYTFRIFIEHFKENQVAFEDSMSLNMGQLLSVPFIIIGLAMVFGLHRKLTWLAPAFTHGPGGLPAPEGQDAAGGGASGEDAGRGKSAAMRKQRRKLERQQEK